MGSNEQPTVALPHVDAFERDSTFSQRHVGATNR